MRNPFRGTSRDKDRNKGNHNGNGTDKDRVKESELGAILETNGTTPDTATVPDAATASAASAPTSPSHRLAQGGVTVSVFVLLAAVLLSVGLGGGFLLTRSRIPQSLRSSGDAGSMTVSPSSFDDARSVQLTVTLGSSSTVTSPVSGTVTSSSCTANGTVSSGSAPFGVDATPVLALHTSTPLYRELSSGMRGDDARALNDALRALGYAAPDSDWFVWDSIAAYNALADSVGARRLTADAGWRINPSFFMWLPADTVTVAECKASVGQQVTAGMETFVTGAAPVKASLPAKAQDMLSGDRLVSINGQDIAVPEGTAELADQTAMAAVAGSGEFRLAQLSAGQSTGAGGTLSVTYTWRLANPVEAVTVPPSAVYDAQGETACVVADDRPTPVRIIASQLGKTMVSPDGVDAFTSVEVAPTDASPCREG